MKPDVEVAFARNHPLASEILSRLNNELSRIGISESAFQLLPLDDASYCLEKDPSNGKYSLIGEWKNKYGTKTGSMMFNTDGQFYVEQDVVLPHPTKKQWFIEAVTAWGTKDDIKSEAKLIPNPGA